MRTVMSAGPEPLRAPGPVLGWLALGFTALGLVCIAVPQAATLAVTLLVAATMMVWGALGVGMAFSMRRFPEWRLSALAFSAVAVLGLVFLVFPAIGIEAMTLVLVASFLVEGIVSVLFGLRLSGASGR